MPLYKDYFRIRPGYSEIMTHDYINKTPETWLDFYPHKTFVEILREMLAALSGGKKSLWISGTYGSGKSHASLVLQKLLCDDEGRVKKWLERNSALIPKVVANELLAVRAKKVAVVYDINSDDVDPKSQFLMRMQRAITKTLDTSGHRIPLRGKLDDVIERIRQDEPHFFAKRDEMQESLSYLHDGITSADQLAKKMYSPKRGLDTDLISDAMKVLEARNIYLGLEAAEFLRWVDDALKVNGISKLVYIWDEFSSFVNRNRSELKTMEELAEAFEHGRFYFVPVTHTKLTSYLAAGSESARKAKERFTDKPIGLPDDTALKLAAHAFDYVKDRKEADEWSKIRDELWQHVRMVAENHIADTMIDGKKIDVDAADFKNLLPIHPMAAFLLRHLSEVVGSSSRSIFKYLNGAEFKDFVERGGIDVPGRQLLTVDHLWNHFMERDDPSMDTPVQEARAEYARREKSLQPDERRVFKTVLLFSLIEAKQGKDHPLLCASVENILRSFEGDGAMQGVGEILKDLEHKHCFTIIDQRCERYRDRLDSVDIAKNAAKLDGKFDEVVLKDSTNGTQKALAKLLEHDNHGERFDVRVSDVNGLSPSTIPKLDTFGENGNRILLHFILAKDEEEQLRIPDKARDLAKRLHDHRVLFATLPEVNFCHDNANAWEDLKEHIVRRSSAKQSGDSAGEKVFVGLVNGAMDTWHSKVTGASKVVIYLPNAGGEPHKKEVTWEQLKKVWLNEYAKKAFEDYTDYLGGYHVSAFGRPTALQSWALAGMEFEDAKPGAPKTYATNWQKAGVTPSDSWFDENPNHPLAKMRDFCNGRLDNALGARRELSIRKLYIDYLQRQPYGLLRVPHSAFVLGFVLKAWLGDQRGLQWTDGVDTRPLDKDALAEMIETAVRDEGGNKPKGEKLVCRLSKAQREFIAKSSVIFGYTPLGEGSVEAALRAIGERLKERSRRVPLWVLPDYIEAQAEPSAEPMRKIIEAICAANIVSSKGDREKRGNKIEEAGEILLAKPDLAEAMAKYIDPMHFEHAFRCYVDATRPDLKEVVERLGDTSHAYCDAIKRLCAGDAYWLWKRGDIETVIEDVYRQMLCIEHVRKLAGITGPLDIEDALDKLRSTVCGENRVPPFHWAKKHPALTQFFELLTRPSLVREDTIALEKILAKHSETIRDLFFDPAQAKQLEAMREIFGGLWPASDAESRELYNEFPQDSSRLDEPSFKGRGRAKIEEYGQKQVSAQVGKLWMERTQSVSPEEWAKAHGLPAECALTADDAKGMVNAMTRPWDVSAERLSVVHEELSKDGAFLDVERAKKKFLKRALHGRDAKISVTVNQLSDWLQRELGDTPNSWLNDPRLDDAIEGLIRHTYNSQIKGKALEKVTALSDARARELLLKLIDQIPDVGISILE